LAIRHWSFAALCVLVLVGGCNNGKRAPATQPTSQPATQPSLARFEYEQVHMGVWVRMALYAPSEAQAQAAAEAAMRRIAQLDATLSDYRRDSELNRMCDRAWAEPVPVSDDLYAVLDAALDVARASDGAFDPTVAPAIALWRQARRTKQFPEPEALARARDLIGYQKITLDPIARTVKLADRGMRLDLGGIAKGHAIEEALKVLRSRGITRCAIEHGGDIVVGDPPPGAIGWIVEVTDERSGRKPRKEFFRNCAVSTSGDTFQYVVFDNKRYSHIVDPKTGIGLENQWLVTVTGPNGTLVDALSTAASVLGPSRVGLLEHAYARSAVKFRFARD
jgi:FAD:protein FMN transferase